ncbi:MAG: DNA repair exonuclease [Candidatus Aenigmarchaeota archaeon]|nr:DNA repair exonuclease [Candidatus Aenigmarchaeota archaeon]
MKISILSDLHFGYVWNSKLENDSFDNAREAIEKSLDSDLILIIGDIFDSRIPNTEIWDKALEVLSGPLLSEDKEVKLLKLIEKDIKKISERTLIGIPVVALHGTHERRGRDQINAIQAMEQAGFLIHLHCNGLVFEKDGQKVAIQGMSGVPERYAKTILDKWNPKPVKGCYNILMFHQSVEPYVYSPLDPPTLTMSNLPQGFDLIINGHIHNHEKTKINGTDFIIPGSTIVTQLKEEESKVPRGFYKLELPKRKFTFIELEKNRKFFYREINLDGASVKNKIESELEKLLKNKFNKKPLIKFKIIGKKTDLIDKDLKDIEKKFSKQCILRFQKKLESEEIEKKLEFLKKMREEKLSIEEMGIKILKENLDKLKFKEEFDSENFFKLLSDNQTERALDIITKKQQTLKQFGG